MRRQICVRSFACVCVCLNVYVCVCVCVCVKLTRATPRVMSTSIPYTPAACCPLLSLRKYHEWTAGCRGQPARSEERTANSKKQGLRGEEPGNQERRARSEQQRVKSKKLAGKMRVTSLIVNFKYFLIPLPHQPTPPSIPASVRIVRSPFRASVGERPSHPPPSLPSTRCTKTRQSPSVRGHYSACIVRVHAYTNGKTEIRLMVRRSIRLP